MQSAKPKILCVDDEPNNLKLLEAMLSPHGYDILKSTNGAEALEQIKAGLIDFVLLDVMMPEINGYQVCQKIKEDERTWNIPVVMITALASKEDRVKGIEAGAEDFITKPFDHGEVLARVKMLLRIKELNDRLNSAYDRITDLTGFGEKMVMSFDPLNYDFLSSLDGIVGCILRKTQETVDKPEIVIVGFVDEADIWQWYKFDSKTRFLNRTWLKGDMSSGLNVQTQNGATVFLRNEEEIRKSAFLPLLERLREMSISASNMVCFTSPVFCIYTLNYGKAVSKYDAEVLNSIVMQGIFLKSLSAQVKETEHAFDYLVFALARAAEANDEDTGNHILRVGEYSALIAKELSMSDKFTDIIRIHATLHDVGKIHVHPNILKKPDRLTPGEYDEMKRHTIAGAKILGEHVRLTVAKKAALSHHERWDGSGYPCGLKEEQIPLEGRILNIADQYDALRNQRVYKPAYDHRTTYRILTEGDGRTLPHHFDPQVLKAFKDTALRFEEVYERMKG